MKTVLSRGGGASSAGAAPGGRGFAARWRSPSASGLRPPVQNAPSPTVTFKESAKYPNLETNSEPGSPYPTKGAIVSVQY